MGRARNKLTAVAVKKSGTGRLSDGAGLFLDKKDNAGKWTWRYSIAGRRRDMGLGGWPQVSLADARKERDKWEAVLAGGADPISERRAELDRLKLEMERSDPTLETLARDVLEAKKASLRGEGKNGRWMSPLKGHVFPKIGHKSISEITQVDIRDALAPIWKSKQPTAEKAIQRLGIVFRQGKLMGFDCDPFTVEAAKHMLGEVLHRTASIPATPWQDIPDLYARLSGQGNVATCLQFMILTLVRVAGCRMARFDEINDGVWTVPADRMKGKVGKVDDFRVPLSTAAMRLVEYQRELGGEYLFTGHRGRPITDNSLSKRMRTMGEEGRPHGFRTSFRTWVQDTDGAPWDVSETILAHKIGGKVERSYARSDLLDRRRIVMEKWAAYVTNAGSSVVKFAVDY